MSARLSAVTTLAAALVLGCQAASTSDADSGPVTAAPPAGAIAPYAYIEKIHDGRLYVLGSLASAEAFDASGHLQYTLTLIGGGPEGRTVVIEVSKEDPAMQEWLKAQVQARYYYFEERHEGRIYVIGRPGTHEAFRQTHQLLYSLTLLGAGPDGETVVIEADQDDESLQQRLRSEFERRHG